ncbi:MAG: bifunctional adenosylcobinamide kinase/adenosylcobinamide-phosphate guanylyltransferase [Ectothiorhodospiraceae bacterium]|nr:bifunctional adenosylcobinamide kinase/adenosylcobinamide-phosphate guanylyltransferase [Ectothiorhodospiraceae bacterium]
MAHHALVLGGIRSGKSLLAEQLATASRAPVVYVATAEALDGEMSERIRRHRQRRPEGWGLVEESLDLAGVLARHAGPAPCLLVYFMSLWLSNLLHAGEVEPGIEGFLAALGGYPGPVVIVSNEVGLGTIGMDALTRQFADRLGLLNQQLAAHCDTVVLTVAGLPTYLKGVRPGP